MGKEPARKVRPFCTKIFRWTQRLNFNFTADGLTALEFSPEGNFLATGDRNGKIAILHMEESRNKAVQTLENWLPLCQFQSHEPEFDFLKSLEIEGKINQIKFLKSNGLTNCLLSTNGKSSKIYIRYCRIKDVFIR